MERTLVVVSGGPSPDRRALAHLPDPARVIAVDSGLDHARAVGLPVHQVIGDLDSVPAEALAAAGRDGIDVVRHPREKDAVDLELALAAAKDQGATQITVLAGAGDRLDHLVAGLLLLVHPMLAGIAVDAYVGSAHVLPQRGPGTVTVHGRPGEYVSLLPVLGTAGGVTTTGLRYPLHGEPLVAASSRGVSNELAAPVATVRIESGCLLVVRPDALEVPA